MKTIIEYLLSLMFLHGVFAVKADFSFSLGHIKSLSSPQEQENAASDVIRRLIFQRSNEFLVDIDPDIGDEEDHATFHILKNKQAGKVNIKASSGVAATWGFHYYLKHFCGCHVSWDSDQLKLPKELPLVDVIIKSPDRFRYYQNVCTTSYSFVWWDWERWEREIDWMALNGFNFVLASNGQEAIWQRVYTKLNLTVNEINEHFTGPAFLSWGRMGNIRGWGGYLSTKWHATSIALQHNIVNRMRALGIVPILPAFSGQVPRAFKRIYPNAQMTKMSKWNNFEDRFCCPYLLEPTEPLFRTVGNLFLKELITEFGTNHAYNCDTFNEMTPSSRNLTYLSGVGASVFQAMTDVDPKAIWVLQNWFLVNSHPLTAWTIYEGKAFITSVPQGRMIVLDLQSELLPQYRRLQSYFGQPFIWCMLHNFGGTLGLYGAMEEVNKGVFSGRNMANSTMIGTGLTPEGINQNYVMYDLMNELAYHNEPVNLTLWISSYAKQRYGQSDPNANQAWQILKSSVYSFQGLLKVRGKYVMCKRPSLKLRPWYWYKPADVLAAWEQLLSASKPLKDSKNYQHDIVDVTRQALQLLADGFFARFIEAFKRNDTDTFQKSSRRFLLVLRDLDWVLSSNKDFLLGSWLNAAKSRASSPLESSLFEMNARSQITLWGPRGEINDYANKQWAGIVSNYFIPRWQIFIAALNDSLVNKTTFNQKATDTDIYLKVEHPFVLSKTVFPEVPIGDSIQISLDIYRRWKKHDKLWVGLNRFQIPATFSKRRAIATEAAIGGEMEDYQTQIVSVKGVAGDWV